MESETTTTAAMRTVRVRSCDGVVLEVPEAVAIQSEAIKHIVEDVGVEFPIPMQNADAEILRKIFEYCTKHVEFNTAAAAAADNQERKEIKEEMERWDKEFVEGVSLDTLYDLIIATNFLAIEELLDLCCDRTADLIRGKTAEEIRATFNIKNDFTPEEEEEFNRN